MASVEHQSPLQASTAKQDITTVELNNDVICKILQLAIEDTLSTEPLAPESQDRVYASALQLSTVTKDVYACHRPGIHRKRAADPAIKLKTLIDTLDREMCSPRSAKVQSATMLLHMKDGHNSAIMISSQMFQVHGYNLLRVPVSTRPPPSLRREQAPTTTEASHNFYRMMLPFLEQPVIAVSFFMFPTNSSPWRDALAELSQLLCKGFVV